MRSDGQSHTAPAGERADILASLRRHRDFLRFTARDVTDQQARQRTTVSELTLGGLVKHLAEIERIRADFVVNGPAADPGIDWTAVDWENPPPEVAATRTSPAATAGRCCARTMRPT
jgi:Protein of unknown function (DUF664)